MTALPRLAGLPGIGSLIPFARDPLGFLERASQLGDMVTYEIVENTIVQLNHPDLVEKVLVEMAKTMHKDAIYAHLRPLMGNGLVTSEDEVWRRQRKMLAPSFSRRHVDQYAQEFVRCARDYVDGLREGEERDAHVDLMALTQRIVLNTLFGTELGVDTARAAHAIEEAMEGFVFEAQGLGRLLPKLVPTPTRRRTARAIVELDEVIFSIIAARRSKGLGDDMLSRLIEAQDEAGALSDLELRDQAVTTFVAGHETTALALTYTVVLLAERPECWAQLHAEADRVLGQRPAEATDLAELRYTRAVIEEAMRLLPAVWTIGRELQQDITLGEHTLAAGTQVLIPLWVLHRDPRWFTDPLAFRPERWLDGLRERLPRMAYLPFGGGPRVCIGNHFALLEAVLLLATFAQRVQLVATGGRPRLFPSITLRPRGGVPMRIVKRA
jgi:cytochrome P450